MLSALLLSGITVVLQPQAQVDGLAVELGEVAEVTTTDADLKARIEAYDLGGAPSPGHARLLLGQRIAADLRRDFPQHSFIVQGASSVRVEPLLRQVPGAQIQSAAQLAVQMASAGRDIEVKLVGKPEDASIASGTGEARVNSTLAPAALRSGRVSVPVEVHLGERLARTVWVPFEVTEYERVAVLTQPLQPGQPVHPSYFRIVRRERSGQGSQILTPEEIYGSVATRALAAGQTVGPSDVRKVVMIQAGARVRLVVRRGQVSVTTSCVVVNSAGYGEQVRVLPDTGGRELQATVAGRGLVVMDLDPDPTWR